MMWKIVAVVFGLLVLALVAGAYQATTPEGRERAQDRLERAKDREMIAKCREAQNDELSDLATRRFMRRGCDEMEASYRRKWRRNP
jgi:hypothetical protein